MSKPKLISQQQGMVAIVTTMILMIVISIIVLGFSQVVRRNQRQVLDSQLSSQAFYAAESGINIARAKLAADPSFRSDSCGTAVPLGGDNNVEVTCLLVQGVETLRFDKLSTTSKVSLIQPEGGANVGSLYINWESANGSAVTTGCTTGTSPTPTNQVLPSSWPCSQPMLRVDLVPLEADGVTMTRTALSDSQFTAFLYPKRNNNPNNPPAVMSEVAWGTAVNTSKGAIVPVICSNSLGNDPNKKSKCSLRIHSLPVKNRFAIRLMSIYGEANLNIHASGNPILEGAQMVVDSTGRAADVLKRVQARIPINGVPGQQVPSFAIDTAGPLCKQYQLMAGDTIYGSPPSPGCTLTP